jgi:hypothetical protein
MYERSDGIFMQGLTQASMHTAAAAKGFIRHSNTNHLISRDFLTGLLSLIFLLFFLVFLIV